MFTEFDYKDPSKANYYYIFIIISTLTLFLTYLVIYILEYLKRRNSSRKASITLELGKLDINQILQNYRVIYNEENIDMEKITNINAKAKSLKFRYLLGYLCTRASIWSKAPYIYLLFNKYHGFNISQIGILYIIDAVCALVFGPLTGDLADRYGRRLFCILYCLCGIISQSFRLTGNIPLAYFSQILTGFGAGLISTTFEAWINYEADKDLKQGKRVFLEKLFKTQTILDSIMSLLISGLGAVLFTNFGLLYPILLSIFLSACSICIMLVCWDENKPNSKQENKQQKSFTEALQELKDPKILSVGLIESFYSAVLNIYIFSWTPLLQHSTIGDINVGFIYILFVVFSLLGAAFYDIFLIILKTNYLKLMTYSLLLEIAMFLLIFYVENFNLRLIFLSTINAIKAFFVPINALLKANTLPEVHRATLMNIFRIPLNIYVIFVLLVLKYINPLTLCLLCIGIIMFALPPIFYLYKNLQLPNSTHVMNRSLDEDDSLSFRENDLKEKFLKA